MKYRYNPFTRRLDTITEGQSIDTSQFEKIANKGVPGGYAALDATGKVPAAQLPSYVDDVQEYADLASFPATGESGIIYVALDTKKIYRWSGSSYIEIAPSEVTSVDGRTGAVTLSDRYAPLSHTHDWTEINNKPSPIITLQGDVSGSGTMNELGNVTINTTASGGASGDGVPIGTIVYWPTNTPPSGWLKCDGSLLSKDEYLELFNAIGFTFGRDNPTDVVLNAQHSNYTSSTGIVHPAPNEWGYYPAWQAFDRNTSTYTRPRGTRDEYWVIYEFNEPKWVDKVKMYVLKQARSFSIYGSNDSNWQLLYSGYFSRNTYYTCELAQKGEYKYYKIYRADGSTGRWADIQFLQTQYDENLFRVPNISTPATNIIAIIKALP